MGSGTGREAARLAWGLRVGAVRDERERGQCGVACASKRRKTEMRQDKWWKDGVDSAGVASERCETSGGLMEREGGSTRIKGELRARACGGCVWQADSLGKKKKLAGGQG